MDTTALIGIIVTIIVAYFIIRFIVSPLIKIIIGVVAILLLVYLLQKFLGFNINNILSSFGISSPNSNSWSEWIDNLFSPISGYLDQVKNFFSFLWENVNKGAKIKN